MAILFMIVGILFIVAGINEWEIPTIKTHLRNIKFGNFEIGEVLNFIIMLLCGILFIVFSVFLLLKK